MLIHWSGAIRELPVVRLKHLQLRNSGKKDGIGNSLDPFYKKSNYDTRGIEIKWFVCLLSLQIKR